MTQLSRRHFLFVSTASGALALSRAASAGCWRPSEELRVAVVGVRSRGKNLVDELVALPDVRVIAVCDVDQSVLQAEQARLATAGFSVEGVQDARRLFDRKDIDAVAIATPNHWHALLSIWACQAGKDVYVEKPVSHSLHEGRVLVRAARHYQRVVQTGTQCRSSTGIAQGIAWVQAGNFGKIQCARGLCYKPRQSIGRVGGPQGVPPSVDYDLWTGPSALRPLLRRNLHYDWHWDFATGNGDVGNQGIHQMDLARWALGEKALAPAVISVGGRLGYSDDGNTPNTQLVYHAYANAPLIFEVRGLPRDRAAQGPDWARNMDNFGGVSIGVVVQCEQGSLLIPDYSQAIALDRDGKELQRWQGAESHMANFALAVRQRRSELLTAEIEEGHISSALCHLGNISHRLGQARSMPEIRAELASRPLADEALERMGQHLLANGVDISVPALTLGAALRVDPSSERLLGEPAAEALARGKHRAPFVLPDVA